MESYKKIIEGLIELDQIDFFKEIKDKVWVDSSLNTHALFYAIKLGKIEFVKILLPYYDIKEKNYNVLYKAFLSNEYEIAFYIMKYCEERGYNILENLNFLLKFMTIICSNIEDKTNPFCNEYLIRVVQWADFYLVGEYDTSHKQNLNCIKKHIGFSVN